MNRETITLTKKEQQRAHILSRVQAGTLTAHTAAELLGLSLRHLRRLLADLRTQGIAGLAHGNRGRVSARRFSDAIRARVVALARTIYAGINDHQLTELLQERNGLRLSRPTVRRILRAAGIGSPRTRRPPRHRRRRDRMPQAGLLIQLDASHHAWLEARGPRLVLHAAIDDATGKVLGGIFRPDEDTHGYFLLLRHLIRRYGLPAAVYTDRHGIFHRDPRTPLTLVEELEGRPASTQVGRALEDLLIRWIPAQTPEAKGRIERLFGTFQDRLVAELRLAQATTLSQAQRVLDHFLPRYNARFARSPAHADPAWRPAPPKAELERICSFKHERTVQADNTVQVDGQLLQISPGPGGRSYAKARVEVYVDLDGTHAVYYRGKRLATQPGTHAPHPLPHPIRTTGRTVAASQTTSSAPRSSVPAADHPWRRSLMTRRQKRQLIAERVTFS